MARTDWTLHKEQFERYRDENPSLTLAQYCDNNDLNAATARRHIKSRATSEVRKVRKTGNAQSAQSAQSESKRKTSKSSKKAASKEVTAHGSGCESAQSTESANPKYQKNAQIQDGEQRAGAKKNTAQGRRDRNKAEGFDAPVKPRRRAPPFSKGNKMGMTHGGYATLSSVDIDIQQAAIEQCGDGASYVEVLSVSRALQMDRFASELHQEIEERDCFYKKLLESNASDIGAETIEAIESQPSKAKKHADIIMGMSDRFMSTLQMAHIARNDREKNYFKFHELNPSSATDRAERTTQLFQYIETESLGPVDAARLFEKEGLKVPEILAQEAKHEISQREIELGNEGIFTEEEMKAEEEAFVEEMATMEDQIAQRKEEIEAAIQAQVDAEDEDPDDFVDPDLGDGLGDSISIDDFDASEDHKDNDFDTGDYEE